MKAEKPNCPKCRKEMRLASTGETVRTFYCMACKKTVIVKREKEHKKD